MDKALATAGYDDLAAKKAEAKGRGKLLGLALSTYIEVCGVAPSKWIGAVGEGWGAAMWESSNIRVHLTGKVVVTMGTQPQGQGHETTYAQVVAHELGIPMEDIVVQHSDTQGTPFGYGSYGSRTSSVGMTAAIKAADKIKDKARALRRAHARGVARRHRDRWRRVPGQGLARPKKTLQEIAFALDLAFDAPEGMEPYLDETAYYDTPNCTWPFGTHIAIVEIDEETGHVELVRYVAVDDVGNKINPMIVDGQLHGGIAQGVGQALWEGAIYSDEGQLLTGSMLDYALPRASWFPNFELDETVTPSPVNPLGVKGVGEAGAIASTAAVANAVIDALEPARHPPSRHAVHGPDRVAGHPVREGRPGMIPAAFAYQRPATLDAALAALAGGDGSAKVIAGGMSLLPLMKLRLASAETLIDIGRLAELKGVQATADGGFEIGALTTYAEAARGHLLDVRLRATACPASATSRSATAARSAGAIAHADPASDLPALALALDYSSSSLRSERGERTVPLDGFFEGAFQTGLAPDELLVAIRRGPLRAPARRVAYRKLEQPGVGLLDRRRRRGRRSRAAGAITHARVALTGVGDVAYRAKAVEAALVGLGRLRGGRRRGGRTRDRRRHRQRRHPRRRGVPDADGRGLHPPRDRGRARPARPDGPAPHCVRVERVTPGRRAPARLEGSSSPVT